VRLLQNGYEPEEVALLAMLQSNGKLDT
jgi:hypothetical protein